MIKHKNKPLAVLLSVFMTILVLPFNFFTVAVADEQTNNITISELSFEQLVTMDTDEICKISQKYKEAVDSINYAVLEKGKVYYTLNFYSASEYIPNGYVDVDCLLNSLGIPKDLFVGTSGAVEKSKINDIIYDSVTLQLDLNKYNLQNALIAVEVILRTNPQIAFVEPYIMCSIGTVPAEFNLGDCNGDGKFNVADVVLFQKWLLGDPGDPNVELSNWKAADLCEDDKLDVFDLCLMKKALIENKSSDL